jgi:hypothetical protein
MVMAVHLLRRILGQLLRIDAAGVVGIKLGVKRIGGLCRAAGLRDGLLDFGLGNRAVAVDIEFLKQGLLELR